MNQAKFVRGTKRTCLNCEARFYDLARVPAICPKCGTEFVEIVRPAQVRQSYKKASFGMSRPSRPLAAEEAGNPATSEARLEGDDPESDEEREEEFDDETERESKV